MKTNRVGHSLLLFSLTMLVGSIATALFLDALTIDITAFIVLALAVSVIRGSVRAAKWSIVLMVWYIAAGICLICLSIFAPERVHVGSRELLPRQVIWVVPVLSLIVVWCGVNAALLVNLIKSNACLPETQERQNDR